jgi:hypothetical protein
MTFLAASPASERIRLAKRGANSVSWEPVNNGATVGQRGSENGVILCDEERTIGARITLERDGDIAPFAITCGIYGWMFHTRFFGTEAGAATAYERMKEALNKILDTIPCSDDLEVEVKSCQVSEAISAFIEQFP